MDPTIVSPDGEDASAQVTPFVPSPGPLLEIVPQSALTSANPPAWAASTLSQLTHLPDWDLLEPDAQRIIISEWQSAIDQAGEAISPADDQGRLDLLGPAIVRATTHIDNQKLMSCPFWDRYPQVYADFRRLITDEARRCWKIMIQQGGMMDGYLDNSSQVLNLPLPDLTSVALSAIRSRGQAWNLLPPDEARWALFQMLMPALQQTALTFKNGMIEAARVRTSVPAPVLNPLACPNCRLAEGVRKVSSVYADGKTETTVSGHLNVTGGTYIAGGWGLNSSSGNADLSGQSVSVLASKLQPPDRSVARGRNLPSYDAYALANRFWDALYYCSRCDGVFWPSSLPLPGWSGKFIGINSYWDQLWAAVNAHLGAMTAAKQAALVATEQLRLQLNKRYVGLSLAAPNAKKRSTIKTVSMDPPAFILYLKVAKVRLQAAMNYPQANSWNLAYSPDDNHGWTGVDFPDEASFWHYLNGYLQGQPPIKYEYLPYPQGGYFSEAPRPA